MQASDAFSLGELHGAAAAHRRTAASVAAIRDRLSASSRAADIVVDRRTLDALLGSILDTLTEGATQKARIAEDEMAAILATLTPEDRADLLVLSSPVADPTASADTNAEPTGTKP